MINLLTQLFKYIGAVLIAIYAIQCFVVFGVRSEKRQKRMYANQNFIMFTLHGMLSLIIFLNNPSISILILYVAQVMFFIAGLLMYSNMYKNASRLLINNMFFLMMIGFVMLARLGVSLATKQFAIAVAAVALSLVIPIIIEKFRFLSHLGIFYGLFGLFVVGLVFICGKEAYGATNWVTIAGIGFQPSEIAKIIFVFFVASMLYKNTSLFKVIITTIIAAGFVLILVYETDLGAAVIFFFTYIMMLYVATRQIVWPILGFSGGSVAAVGAYFMFSHVKRRVAAWKDPWGNYNDAGYQIAQSLFAIGTGGWFGMGLYQGGARELPVIESDFIFSAIAEELGGIFAICLLLIFLSCFIMFINISLQLTNNFYKLLAVGLSIAYGFQIFLCVGGVTKFIPHTGVTLPLISYGGSSILSTILVFAVIQGLYLLKQKEVKMLERQQQNAE